MSLDIVKQGIEKEASISLPDDWQQTFIAYINHLADTDLEKLVYLLYRIDVNENKIKQLLEGKAGNNAGELIANAIIERQLEKVASRIKYQQDRPIDENESW